MTIWFDHNLKAKKYDGLYSPGECACQIGDLRPCGYSEMVTSILCKPGHIVEDSDKALQIGTARVTYIPKRDADGVEI